MLRAMVVLLLTVATAWAQPKGWEKEWNDTLTAAQKEGRVAVAGSPDPVMRNEIIPKFTSRFGIQVEFIAGRAVQYIAKIQTERSAGIYSVDLFMTGVDSHRKHALPGETHRSNATTHDSSRSA